MAWIDYHHCAVCYGKVFYDADIIDPCYVATYAPHEVDEYFRTNPIGIAALCPECNRTYELIIRPRNEEKQ